VQKSLAGSLVILLVVLSAATAPSAPAPEAASRLAASAPGSGAQAAAKDKEQVRSVSGIVHDQGDSPLADAIVYLKNTRSLAVKTYITDKEGGYRFHALSPNVDYELYAEYNGRRSSTKTVSSFDDRSQIIVNLKIDVKK